jgi:hypothetical protein
MEFNKRIFCVGTHGRWGGTQGRSAPAAPTGRALISAVIILVSKGLDNNALFVFCPRRLSTGSLTVVIVLLPFLI